MGFYFLIFLNFWLGLMICGVCLCFVEIVGNVKVGRIIMGVVVKYFMLVILEFGGKCFLFIDDLVDLKVSWLFFLKLSVCCKML